MRILFITTKCPLPMNDGHSIRTFNLLKQLVKVHTIHLLSFVKFQEEFQHVHELQQLCKTVNLFNLPENISKFTLLKSLVFSIVRPEPFVVIKYNKKNMRNGIRKILTTQKIDIVHLDMLPLGCYLNEFKNYKTILNAHNVESFLLKRRVERDNHILSKYYFNQQQHKLAHFERSICRKVDHIASCSQQDYDIFRKHFANNTPMTIVPNGVDTDFFSKNSQYTQNKKNIVFVGGLNWYPNIDGLRWFDQTILPIIIAQKPDIHLHIIGISPDKINWENSNNITCHGFVEDTRPFIEKSCIFIVPLKIGGGTRLKILNAMAMGKAVISTTIGEEGLQAHDGEDIVIADDAESFAQAVLDLLTNTRQRQTIETNAQQFILENYQWSRTAQKLLNAYDSVQDKKTTELAKS